MTDDENLLAERVKAHDVAALAEYLWIKRKPLAAYVERELGTALRRKVEVDDILQEVSVEAARSLLGVDFDHRDVFSWLCQLAERRIITLITISSAPKNGTSAAKCRWATLAATAAERRHKRPDF